MHRYLAQIMIQVEIEAPSDSDAEDIINDCFGEGPNGGSEVVAMEVLDFAQLT